MVLSLANVQEAMQGRRLSDIPQQDLKLGMDGIMRDISVLAGYDPDLIYGQTADMAKDLAAGYPMLTLEEIKLAGKAGVAGELGGPKKPSYAAMMQWTDAYHKSAMVADARKIRKNRKAEPKRITVEEGWKIFCENMPLALDRRWEDVRTLGKFGNATVPHVSAQLYDWLGDEGVLHLTDAQKDYARKKGKAEAGTRSVWDRINPESDRALTLSRVKHYALEVWMQDLQRSGARLPVPEKITKFY